jgi:hypothetical protein
VREASPHYFLMVDRPFKRAVWESAVSGSLSWYVNLQRGIWRLYASAATRCADDARRSRG